MNIPESVLSKIRSETCTVYDLPGNCLNYYGATSANGYARAYIAGQPRSLHRYIWELANGEIPDKLELDHLCRNRRCVNPDHLEPVTGAENIARRSNPPYRLRNLDREAAEQLGATMLAVRASREATSHE